MRKTASGNSANSRSIERAVAGNDAADVVHRGTGRTTSDTVNGHADSRRRIASRAYLGHRRPYGPQCQQFVDLARRSNGATNGRQVLGPGVSSRRRHAVPPAPSSQPAVFVPARLSAPQTGAWVRMEAAQLELVHWNWCEGHHGADTTMRAQRLNTIRSMFRVEPGIGSWFPR
jgi:hypothetical protein